MQHRIGAYLRVSTEEQAQVIEGSIDSQRHRLQSFVDLKNVQEKHWGKVIEIYSDEGFSAKDTKRPALQRLLGDLRIGKINLILVTDLSRLSRNILDFCLLLEDLKKHSGKFLSVKEQFDTTTAAGEMMVFNMINLSQFERKQVAERVSMNFHSRAMRGLLNGGPVILGYDKDPAKSAQYIVNEAEAQQVREIFRIFLEEGSVSRAVLRLNESGIAKKVGRKREHRLASKGIWSISTLKNLIQNKAYIGIREVNKKYKSQDAYTLKPWQQHQESKAAWPGIVTDDSFNTAQKILLSNQKLDRPKPNHKNGSPFILTGRLQCADCGAPFIGETGHGRISDHRYYAHKQYQGIPFKCPVKRFPAELAEEAVEAHLAEIALNPKEFKKVEIGIGATFNQEIEDLRSEKERLQLRLLGVDQESQKVFQLLGDDMGDAGLKMVKEKIASLGDEKTRLTARLAEIDQRKERASNSKKAVTEIEDRIVEFQAGWNKGTLATKKRLIRAIIDRLEVSPGLLGLYYLVPQDGEGQGPQAPVLRPDFAKANSMSAISEVQNKKAAGNSVIPAALGSCIKFNGVTDWSKVEPIFIPIQTLVKSKFSSTSNPANLLTTSQKSNYSKAKLEALIRECIEVKKLTFVEIIVTLGVSLTTVLRVCRTLKIGRYSEQIPSELRSNSSQQPYGWKSMNGVLEKDPDEWHCVELMFQLRSQGLSLHKIAAELTHLKMPTKNGGRWFAKSVSQILKFNEKFHNNQPNDRRIK